MSIIILRGTLGGWIKNGWLIKLKRLRNKKLITKNRRNNVYEQSFES